MKNTILLLSLSILCACADKSAESPKPAVDEKTSYSYFPGSFLLYSPGQDIKNPVIPSQISLNIEEARLGHEIVLKNHENILAPKTSNETVVSFGCGLASDINKIPSNLEVGVLILCGDIKYSGPALTLTANHIIMKNLNFSMVRQIQTKETWVNSEFRLSTNLLTLMDSNFLHFAGSVERENRNFPPNITLSIASFEDIGTLKVTALAAVRKN